MLHWSRLFLLVSLGFLAMLPVAEAAGLQCTTADKSKWLPPTVIRKMLQDHGFVDVGAVKANDGNCYVVQATDQSGAKKVLYLDPTDGALMGME
ncbi:MAG TPA: PepSY domain-containing protein [Dongiaceae bacterium]